jgi:hypothetical protein
MDGKGLRHSGLRPQSKIGKLDKAFDEGTAKGWTIVDMKRDWKKVFAFEP